MKFDDIIMNFKLLLALFLALATVELKWEKNKQQRRLTNEDYDTYRQYHYRDYYAGGNYNESRFGRYGYGGFNNYYGGIGSRYGTDRLPFAGFGYNRGAFRY